MITKTKVSGQSIIPADALFVPDQHQKAAHSYWRDDKQFRCIAEDGHKLCDLLIQGIAEDLARGQSVLLQIEDPGFLSLLHHALADRHLAHLALLNGNPLTDDFFAALLLAYKKPPDESIILKCQAALYNYNKQSGAIRDKLQLPFKPVFGDTSWLHVLARLLQLVPRKEEAVLAARLEPDAFEWTPKEYWMLRGRIESYNKLSDLKSATAEGLHLLNMENFESESVEEMRTTITSRLRELKEEGKHILIGYASVIANYKQERQSEYMATIQQLRNGLQRLEQNIDRAVLLYGEVFMHESSFGSISQQIRKQFSRSAKELVQARSQLKQDYLKLTEMLREGTLPQLIPEWDLPDMLTIESIKDDIAQLKKAADACPERMHALLKEQQMRLNANNINADHPLAEHILTHEKQIEDFIQKVNASRLFIERREVNALSLTRKSRVVEDILLDCRSILQSIDHLEEYLFWNSFWQTLPDHIKSLLHTLEIFDPGHRLEIFDYWYMTQIVNTIHPTALVGHEEIREPYVASRKDLSSITQEYIRMVQQSARNAYFQDIPNSESQVIKSLGKQDRQRFTAQLELLSRESKQLLFPVHFIDKEPLKPQLTGYDRIIKVGSQSPEDGSTDMTYVMDHIPSGGREDADEIPVLHLAIVHCVPDFHWTSVELTARLAKIRSLSSQFAGVAQDLEIYNGHKLQLFSFLGESIDRHILSALDMPYKYQKFTPEEMIPQITESLLDTRKPVFVLCRDSILGDPAISELSWSLETIALLKKVGIHVINSWSADWHHNAGECITRIANTLRTTLEKPSGTAQTNPVAYAGS